MIRKAAIGLAVCAAIFSVSAAAQAACLNKAAIATSASAKGAKWFALETMVQSVSWGLWPSFISDGSTPGYRIAKQRYSCKNSGGAVTCKGWATFCPTGKK
jgi:hypothetical protein